MNDKDLIEFFIYLRDNCYNRDFNMEPKRIVECFYEYRNEGYKLPIHDVSSQVCELGITEHNKSIFNLGQCHKCYSNKVI